MYTTIQSEKTDNEQQLIELEKIKTNLEHQLREMEQTIKKQQEMIVMARRDPLTGLRNRQGIPELVNASLRTQCEGNFFIMDMDNFKSINDTYGHMEGDRVLVKFAKALKGAVEPKDIAARLGGDEFVVFSPGHFDKYEVKAKAKRFIRQIEHSLATPKRPVQVTVSIGISSAPHDGMTYETLYEAADKALYSVKNEGKNGYCFFDELTESMRVRTVHSRPNSTLTEITGRLSERHMEGSLEVSYSHFMGIYRFMERNLIRSHREVQCVLFTLADYTDADDQVIQQQLEQLQHAIVSSLRKGDVTAKYSATQILVLLIDANRESADMVVKRILSKRCLNMINVLYDIQQLDATPPEWQSGQTAGAFWKSSLQSSAVSDILKSENC